MSKIVLLNRTSRVVGTTAAALKAQQAIKIKELRGSLAQAGFATLDEQARALGLARSTTWTLMRGAHKCSGLSAAIIKRMLVSPNLPMQARQVLREYIEARLAGDYGHSRERLQAFRSELASLQASGFGQSRSTG